MQARCSKRSSRKSPWRQQRSISPKSPRAAGSTSGLHVADSDLLSHVFAHAPCLRVLAPRVGMVWPESNKKCSSKTSSVLDPIKSHAEGQPKLAGVNMEGTCRSSVHACACAHAHRLRARLFSYA